MKQIGKSAFAGLVIAALLLLFGVPLTSLAADGDSEGTNQGALVVTTAAAAVAELGVLKGDGAGVTDVYLAKETNRMQAAILYLRLIGKEQEALAFTGTDTFADADKTGQANRPVLAFLKAHPEYGWIGTGTGMFDPARQITARELYKVMLEALGYRSDSDFAFKDTLTFASGVGLYRAADVAGVKNRDLAVVLSETLRALPKGSDEETLLDILAGQNVVSATQAMLLSGGAVDIRTAADGSAYLTDGHGMTLYVFTRDMADLSTCAEACLANWPVFYSDHLLLADGLASGDFGVSVRSDGAQQITYKGWPLYYFAKDTAPGDTNGEGLNNVWYKAKQPFYTVALGTGGELGNYLTDSKGRTLYYFDKDTVGASVCAEQCLANWPAFHADSVVVPSGLAAADFGEITRADGKKQTTFKGYPLYYFVQDTKRGDVNGQDVGGVWFVVSPSTFAGTTAGNAAQEAPAKATVEMIEYSFTPTTLTVKAGTEITFINRDDGMQHNAVAVNGAFETKLLSKGESATIKLDEPGTYEYYCMPHQAFMRGTIIVE